MGKFGNKKVVYNGIKFDSKKEFERYLILKGYESSGLIKGLELQKPFELIPAIYEGTGKARKCIQRPCKYVADFYYYDVRKNEHVVEDTKGYRTKEYQIKKKLMLYVFGIKIIES